MLQDERNRSAIRTLLIDAEHALALTHFEDVRGNQEIVRQTIARARISYDDLLRRRSALTLSVEECASLQDLLDRLRAALRFFGEAV